MRRRVGFVGVLGLLALGLIAPPVVSAGGEDYSYRVMANYCDGDEPVIRVRLIKHAGIYASRFQIVAQGQHKNLSGGSWRNQASSTTFSKNIPNGSDRFTWTKGITWNPPDGNWHRIKLRLKAYEGNTLVAVETVFSVRC